MATVTISDSNADVNKDTIQEEYQDAMERAEAEKRRSLEEMEAARKHRYSTEGIVESGVFQSMAGTLECEKLNDNKVFQKLKTRLTGFVVHAQKTIEFGLTEFQKEHIRKSGFSFEYRVQVHKSLRTMLRNVITCSEDKLQLRLLGDTYQWYFDKLVALGDLSQQELDAEYQFQNSANNQLTNACLKTIKQAIQNNLVGEDFNKKYQKRMFDNGLRSMHTDLAPAKNRIQDYRVKTFGKDYVRAMDNISSRPKSAKLWGSKRDRPQTSMSNATTTKAELNPQLKEAPSARVQSSLGYHASARAAELTTQASSQNIKCKFEHQERAQSAHPFKTFYTTGDPVAFQTTNTFEGRSNYFHYYPTGSKDEQKLEKIWFEEKNKQLQEKRLNEETKQVINEWSETRSRMESEIARKKEHMNEATNFAKARGFVRTCWKSKNYNPTEDPTAYDSSTDESDEDEINFNAAKKQADGDVPEDIDEVEDESYEEDQYEKEPIMDYQDQQNDDEEEDNQASVINKKRTQQKMFVPPEPQFIDTTSARGSEMLSANPIIAEQLESLEAIKAYNKALPARRRKKDTLPLVKTSNISQTRVIVRDHKKKNGNVEYQTKYLQIGIIDGCSNGDIHDDQFSISSKVRHLAQSSSKQKIANIRSHYGGLISSMQLNGQANTASASQLQTSNTIVGSTTNATTTNPADKQMPEESLFSPQKNMQTFEDEEDTISMSVFSHAKRQTRRRPKTAQGHTQEQLLQRIPGYKPPPVVLEEGQEAPPEPKPPVLPDFGTIMEMVTKSAVDASRQENLQELFSIKNKLAHDGCAADMKVLQKAIMMPEEETYLFTEDFKGPSKYPDAGEGLMKNPFPKKKKKKKGRKGKKKKKK